MTDLDLVRSNSKSEKNVLRTDDARYVRVPVRVCVRVRVRVCACHTVCV